MDEVEKTLQLLDEGDAFVEYADDVIMVIGNTGSGKSTFVQYIAGDNSQLISVYQPNGSFLITGPGISELQTESYTTFPAMFPYKGLNLYDNPGFNDTRDTAHDIAATYFIKKVLERGKRMKLVLVSDKELIDGADRDNFPRLLKNACMLVKNCAQFAGSIFLVASRVKVHVQGPNRHPITLTTEQVADALELQLKSIRDQLKKPNEIFKDNEEAQRNALNLLDLLVKRTDGELTQLLVFKEPDEEGPLDKIDLMTKEKPHIVKLLSRPPYLPITPDDFGYYLSTETVNDISKIVKKINSNIKDQLESISGNVRGLLESEIQHPKREVGELCKQINNQAKQLDHLVSELSECERTVNFVTLLRDGLQKLEVPGISDKLDTITKGSNYIQFLQSFTKDQIDYVPVLWISDLKKASKFYQQMSTWYSFLSSLYEKLSTYSMQQHRSKYNVKNINDWGHGGQSGITITSSNIKLFLQKLSETIMAGSRDLPEADDVDQPRLAELNELLRLTLRQDLEPKLEDDCLVFRGNVILMSEIKEKIEGTSYSDSNVAVFATDTVHVDCSMDRPKLDFSLVAPVIQVSGQQTISVKGPDYGGYNPNKANTESHGNDGANGANGGHFLSVSIYGSGMLTADVRGGRGQDGQSGGDGVNGEVGVDAEFSEPRDGHDPKPEENAIPLEDLDDQTHWHYRIPALKVGSAGSDAGSGGNGGGGGNSGCFFLIGSNTSKLDEDSAGGSGGAGGRGGQGGRQGRTKFVVCERCSIPRVDVYYKWESNFEVMTPEVFSSGRDGSGGSSGAPGVKSNSQDGKVKLNRDICKFRLYAMENRDNIFTCGKLIALETIIESTPLKPIMCSQAFYTEMIMMEKEYAKRKGDANLLDLYKNLLDRIKQYVNDPDNEEMQTDIGKKSLQVLYTAVVGKICCFERAQQGDLIIDIKSYLQTSLDEVKKYEDKQFEESIHQNKKDFGDKMKKRIDEAKAIIDSQVITEIDKLVEATKDETTSLVDEIKSLEKHLEEQKEALEKLQKQMRLAASLDLISGMGNLLDLGGPYGAAANAVIQKGTSVAESFNDMDTSPLDVPELPDGVKALDKLSKDFKDDSAKRCDSLEQIVKDMQADIDKFHATLSVTPQSANSVGVSDGEGYFDGLKKKLDDVLAKVKEVRDKLDKEDTNLADVEKTLNETEDKVQEEVEKEAEEVNKDDESEDPEKKEKAEKKKPLTDKFKSMAGVFSVSKDTYNQLRGDMDNIKTVGDAMDKINAKIKELQEYKRQVREVMLPMLNNMGNDLKRVESELADKSQVMLDVTQWKMQSKMRDMKRLLDKATEGFEAQEEFDVLINELSEAMTTLIGLYDRIESYKSQAELADYIADMGERGFGIETLDSDHGEAVRQMQLVIQGNVVLDRFQACVGAVKQWVFPFALSFLTDFELPAELSDPGDDVDSLINHAKDKIETLRTRVNDYYATIEPEDRYVRHGDFKDKNPFYSWPSAKYQDSFVKLLAGQEVSLLADVAESPAAKGAIKFNEVRLNFKLPDKPSQDALYEQLKCFDLYLIFQGNSYYRFKNKTYLIEGTEIPIIYSITKEDEDIKDWNEVVEKLKRGELMLSPYGMWRVKLVKNLDYPEADFAKLKQYADKLSLELAGAGKYVNMNDKALPDLQLDTFYQLDRTLDV